MSELPPEVPDTPTERDEALTTPEGAEGWVDPEGSPHSGQAVTADVAPEASPKASEQSPDADEQDSGGEASAAPALDSEGEPIPESHTAYDGAPEGYEPVHGRLPQALADEAAAALLAEQTAREAQLVAEGQPEDAAHRIAFGLPEPEPEPEAADDA